MGRYLGIDYGRTRTGLAISDELGIIAAPINPIVNKSRQESIRILSDLVEKYNLKKIIIGIPLGLEQKPTRMSKEITGFTDELRQALDIEVIMWDETLSSKFAEQRKKALHMRKSSTDSEAARIILQEFLDNEL